MRHCSKCPTVCATVLLGHFKPRYASAAHPKYRGFVAMIKSELGGGRSTRRTRKLRGRGSARRIKKGAARRRSNVMQAAHLPPHWMTLGGLTVEILAGCRVVSDPASDGDDVCDDLEYRFKNGRCRKRSWRAECVRRDEKFQDALSDAIRAGLENCPTAVSTAPCTRRPIFVSSDST